MAQQMPCIILGHIEMCAKPDVLMMMLVMILLHVVWNSRGVIGHCWPAGILKFPSESCCATSNLHAQRPV